MASSLTIYSYGNTDALHGIFNALAMLVSAGDFADMIRIAVLIGFLTVGTMALSPTGISRSWNWFMAVAVLHSIMILPKADVTIIDRLGQSPTVVVGNVPWSLALVGSVKSSVGSTLTELFETGFQTIPSAKALPSELAYLETGVLFGNRLIRGSREAGIPDPNGNADVLNYFRSCVFPEAEAQAGIMQTSTNLRAALANPNPALIVTVHAPGGGLDTVGCDVAANWIDARLDGFADQAIRSLAAKSFPERPMPQAITATESALVTIYGKAQLMTAASTAKDVMVQNILINATAEAAALHTASLDDPALLTLAAARTQAVAQTNAGYLTQGRIGEEALPLVRNVVEGIIYAVFPVICLIALASEGAALRSIIKGYLLAVLWVELWPPMFAVVNYLQTIASTANIGAAGVMTGAQGLALQTAAAVYGTAVSDLSVASWMVTFVPAIAAACLFGMNMLVTQMTGVKPGAQQADASAGQTTKGNHAFGNMSMGQMQVAEFATDPAMRTTTGIGGSRTVDQVSGQVLDEYREGRNLAGVSNRTAIQQELSTQAGESLRVAQQQSQGYTTSIDAVFGKLQALSRGGSIRTSEGLTRELAKVGSEEQMRSDIAAHAARIDQQFKIGDSSAVAKAIGLGASGSARGGKGGLLGAISGLVSGKLSSEEKEGLERALTHAVDDTKTRQAARKEALVDSFRRSETFDELRSRDRTAADSIDSGLREAQGFRTQMSASLDRAESLDSSQRRMQSMGVETYAMFANELGAFMRSQGESPLHGVGFTPRQMQLAAQFAERFEQVDLNGRYFPDMGQGPNLVQAFSPAVLQRHFSAYEGANVGGPGSVRAAGAAFDGRVQAQRDHAGVSPTQPIRSTVPDAVESRQAAVEGRVQGEDAALRESRGDQALKLKERQGQIQEQHGVGMGVLGNQNPITGSRNKALDANRHADPLPAERREAEDRAATVRASLARAVDQIPGATAADAAGAAKANSKEDKKQ